MTQLITREERWCAGRKFARSLALEHIEVYWVPSIRGIIVRSVGAQRKFELPPGTVSVGRYTAPFKTEDFLEDLEAFLDKLAVQQGNPNETAAA